MSRCPGKVRQRRGRSPSHRRYGRRSRVNRRLTAVLGAGAVVLVTGCSHAPTTDGVPTPALRAGAPSPPNSNVAGVPTVDDPLSLDAVLDEPCLSLTDEQIVQYLGDDTTEEVDTAVSSGPACSWNSGMRSDAEIAITYPRITDEGLTALYRNRNDTEFFYEREPVGGYPAISYGIVDSRDDGECLVTVGTSDSDYVNVRVYLGRGSVGRLDPCDAAHDVATDVIANIKATD
ncbi:DUF3558 domain-containing protein [Saccharomonospora piscinae]|uniref:DUF3558 domain-containing protein n=1 Tax=Saccharomonospora piscinae TaxID=687388 RepID=UPI0009C04814|nr:DUF3558 domain-containing protein [Saccharomonospora piscinae]